MQIIKIQDFYNFAPQNELVKIKRRWTEELNHTNVIEIFSDGNSEMVNKEIKCFESILSKLIQEIICFYKCTT